MWSNLPSNLRTTLGVALVLGVGVATAAFTLSFFALREAASNPELKFGAGHAWLFPIAVDMGLVLFEVLLLAASMVRVEEQGRTVQYPRAIPFLLVMVAAACSLYFNATSVPDVNGLRLIALAVPALSILVTLGLAYLLKMLATVSGSDIAHVAPPPELNRVTRRRDTVEGEIVRTDRQTSSGPRAPARVQALAKSTYGDKRRRGQEYLDAHPDATWQEMVRATGISKRYAIQLIAGG